MAEGSDDPAVCKTIHEDSITPLYGGRPYTSAHHVLRTHTHTLIRLFVYRANHPCAYHTSSSALHRAGVRTSQPVPNTMRLKTVKIVIDFRAVWKGKVLAMCFGGSCSNTREGVFLRGPGFLGLCCISCF